MSTKPKQSSQPPRQKPRVVIDPKARLRSGAGISPGSGPGPGTGTGTGTRSALEPGTQQTQSQGRINPKMRQQVSGSNIRQTEAYKSAARRYVNSIHFISFHFILFHLISSYFIYLPVYLRSSVGLVYTLDTYRGERRDEKSVLIDHDEMDARMLTAIDGHQR